MRVICFLQGDGEKKCLIVFWASNQRVFFPKMHLLSRINMIQSFFLLLYNKAAFKFLINNCIYIPAECGGMKRHFIGVGFWRKRWIISCFPMTWFRRSNKYIFDLMRRKLKSEPEIDEMKLFWTFCIVLFWQHVYSLSPRGSERGFRSFRGEGRLL